MRFIWARTNPLQGAIHQFLQQSQARQSHPLMPMCGRSENEISYWTAGLAVRLGGSRCARILGCLPEWEERRAGRLICGLVPGAARIGNLAQVGEAWQVRGGRSIMPVVVEGELDR